MDSSRLVTLHKGGLQTRSWNDAATNLFGSIAGNRWPISSRASFIPLNSAGDVLDISGNNLDASWLGLDSKIMQYWAYRFCSPLSAVIDRLAEADTNGRIEVVNLDGTTRKNNAKTPALNRVLKLLKRPNPMQTFTEYNSEQLIHCKNFGYCPVFAIGPAGMDKTYTKYFVNINPIFATPIANTDFDLYSDDPKDQNPIHHWEVNIYGKKYDIPAEDILIIKDGYLCNSQIGHLGLPLSKVAGLDYWISNICAAMEADNVLLKKKGPLGIFSYDPKPDMAGWTPMLPDQQDELQNDLMRYGLTVGQLQYIVSKIPVKWNSMSFNVQELMTKETVRQGIDGICDRFGYPAELMSGKNATYENRNSAEKFLYQNNVIPFSLRKMAAYDEFFGFEDFKLIQDYDHLPVLQDDILQAGQARKAEAEAIQVMWTSGLLTWNECREEMDKDTVSGMDIYYNDYIKKFPPPMALVKPIKSKEDVAA